MRGLARGREVAAGGAGAALAGGAVLADVDELDGEGTEEPGGESDAGGSDEGAATGDWIRGGRRNSLPTAEKSASKKPAAKKTRGPRVMLFDFDHGPDTDSSDDGEEARDEGGDSDTAVEPSDEEGDGSSSEEASAKVKTKFWCAYKGCRNPPMVKQSFRRHLEMHLANDNKMCTPKHGLRQSMKAEHTMTEEQLVKDQAKMKKTQGEIRLHVRMDGVVAMVFSLTKCVEELSQKVGGLSSQLVTDIIDQASKVKQTIKKKKREATLASTSPMLGVASHQR
ncbi:hypothetical protein PF005_g25176 [Phytophthora fragariae]|uniref:Uncharacterized protein n=1 Tax=Phytophthora fragariae TaxID=53985 RepID=A0A6A3VYM1_9STRA|nr:hypothetical protein PF005_g25176 [Phytophthora fragariae]